MPRDPDAAADASVVPSADSVIQEESAGAAEARGLVPRASERRDGSSVIADQPSDEHMPTPGGGAISINPRDQSMLVPLLRDVVKALGNSPGGLDYQALLAGVEAGTVTADRITQLENFLEMGLHTGRIRARFGALGEEALIRLFHQTPRGATIAGSVGEVSRALAALVGQAIERLDLSAHGPGSYALTIETDRGRLTLRLEPTGVRIGDLELAI
ncbi:MAG: hypothetical protein ACRDIY_10005 [Chloroflexota bacterium]